MSDMSCSVFSPESECVPINRCPGTLDQTLAPPNTSACGFDEESQILMVCCPADQVTDPKVRLTSPLSLIL